MLGVQVQIGDNACWRQGNLESKDQSDTQSIHEMEDPPPEETGQSQPSSSREPIFQLTRISGCPGTPVIRMPCTEGERAFPPAGISGCRYGRSRLPRNGGRIFRRG
ncbi:hypothetical protein G5I_01863 [Acromyrmex echinatior]|uniref:Uncharacterized protein n=1 Tax=Acromyrmex echinatior TaxID=103372 RepID=F4W8S8_ACREC|nr:hypothetical protein G5I_01863 [Acromyrmex echinatior]